MPKMSITACWKKLVACNVASQLSLYTERHILVLSMQTLPHIGCWKARPPQVCCNLYEPDLQVDRCTAEYLLLLDTLWCATPPNEDMPRWWRAPQRRYYVFFRIYLYTHITLIEGYEAACYFVNAHVLSCRADLEPLPGPRDFVHARWKKDRVKVHSEVAQGCLVIANASTRQRWDVGNVGINTILNNVAII